MSGGEWRLVEVNRSEPLLVVTRQHVVSRGELR